MCTSSRTREAAKATQILNVEKAVLVGHKPNYATPPNPEETSSTKVIQYASTQWHSLTSSFNLSPFAICLLCNVQIAHCSFTAIIHVLPMLSITLKNLRSLIMYSKFLLQFCVFRQNVHRKKNYSWHAHGQSMYQLPVKKSVLCGPPTKKQLSECVPNSSSAPSVPPAQLDKSKLNVSWKYTWSTEENPKCANSSANNSDKPSSPECDTSHVKNKKATPSVPPAQPDKLKLNAT